MRLAGEVTKIRFRPGSDQFAVPAGDAIFLCSVADPPYDVVTAGYGRRLGGLDLSPGGDRVAVSDDEGFELFDTVTRRRLQHVEYRELEPPLTIRFDPKSERQRVFRGSAAESITSPSPMGSAPRSSPRSAWAASTRSTSSTAERTYSSRTTTPSCMECRGHRNPVVSPVEQLPPASKSGHWQPVRMARRCSSPSRTA